MTIFSTRFKVSLSEKSSIMKPTILFAFALFFATSVLPETNDSLKYISLGLDELPLAMGKNLTTSKNVKHLCQGEALICAYRQNQAILPSIHQTKKNVFILQKNFAYKALSFVKFSGLKLGLSAKERTWT